MQIIRVFILWLLPSFNFCYSMQKSSNGNTSNGSSYPLGRYWRQEPPTVTKLAYFSNLFCPCPNKCNWCLSSGVTLGPFYQPQQVVNPCAIGKPALTLAGTLFPCTRLPNLPARCPPDSYCHVGITVETTCCCPRSAQTDFCLLPVVPGVGSAVSFRYYFQSETGTCQQFWYRGTAGNQNNFLTLEECEAACKPQRPAPPYPIIPLVQPPLIVNPCRLGRPLTDSNGRYFACSYQDNKQDNCGAYYWCHHGAAVDTTVCCPGAVEPGSICNLPCSTGVGNTSLTRWFYDSYLRQCTSFQYNGLQGNQNNFLSQQSCQAKCEGTENICGQGNVLKTDLGSPVYCSAEATSCPLNAWCHFGSSQEIPTCCSDALPNPCHLRLVKGFGQHSLERWYFNAFTKQCENFLYSGRGGNQNNFLTQSDCYRKCQEIIPNPCLTGSPALSTNLKPMLCVFKSGCGPDYWCHIGGKAETTVCCPGSLEVACTGIPPEPGIGDYQLMRWYYDSVIKQCKQFVYRGLKGNQNNFFTKEDCEAVCPIPQENPCVYAPQFPIGCSLLNPICPENKWCHIGATSSTTTCCDKATPNACSELLAVGNGPAALTRYFYNSVTKRCDTFPYSGLKGNQNNFLTKEECQAKCESASEPNVCPLDQPLLTRNGSPLTCDQYLTTSTCPLEYWCHVGSSEDPFSTVCCRKTTEDVCSLPLSVGQGRHRLKRFYYESNTKRCISFEYSGAKGNENNFASPDLCEIACGEYTNPCTGQPATAFANQTTFCSAANKDVCPVNFWCHVGVSAQTTLCCPGATLACTVPLAPGTGTARLQRWYYNADKKTCEQFEYFGLGGNQNNFETLDQCERVCPAELCALSIDWGTPCHEAPIIRYAYDRASKSCVAFTFNGCGGNLNSFTTMQECSTICSGTAYRRKRDRNLEI